MLPAWAVEVFGLMKWWGGLPLDSPLGLETGNVDAPEGLIVTELAAAG